MKTPDKLLFQLKSHGPSTVAHLAEHFNLTTMGVRQHLNSLTRQRLIKHFDKNEGVGRPTRYWQLTEQGHARYPDCHSELTLQIIDSVKDLFGEAGLNKIIARREQQGLAWYRQHLSSCHTITEKLDQLVLLRTQEGYMASWVSAGNGYLLIENHCPICAAATTCQGFCNSELQQFKALLAPHAKVERTEHIIAGARRCCYSIDPV